MNTYESNIPYRTVISTPTTGTISMSILNWIKHIKIYKIVCFVLLLLVIVPILAHYFVLNVSIHGL